MALRPPGGVALSNTLYCFAILGLIAYFGFSAIQGEYGLTRLIELRAIEADLRTDLERMTSQRLALANKVHRLSDDYLDLELLDQQARYQLGLARADEVIFR
ncbi:MAG: septum formation initiator family protein [Alphaproteobacteria bacterium]|nr:MAG: septum formation initiator family protein [Alphaproteobacteria bacterium]